MKRYYKTQKYKNYNKRHSKKLFRREQQYKLWKKYRLRSEQGIPKKSVNEIHKKYTYVDIPSEFAFLTNTATVINVINTIRDLLNRRKSTFIKLEKVEEIDNGAITILLSIMTEYKIRKIDFNGDFPKSKKAKSLLLSSGFFERLYSSSNKNLFYESSKFMKGKENQIITKPGKNVISTVASKICESVSNTLDKKNATSKGLYRTLIELMHNTNNHANLSEQGKEIWWLTVHHDKIEKKVTFVFLDLGIGIFKSLRNKRQDSKWYRMYDELKERVKYGSDADILELILKGALHKTSTKLSYRGKGLYGIYEVNERRQINNLHIITNNVFANVYKNEYKIINCEFNGTFVYWEINEESEVNEWIK